MIVVVIGLTMNSTESADAVNDVSPANTARTTWSPSPKLFSTKVAVDPMIGVLPTAAPSRNQFMGPCGPLTGVPFANSFAAIASGVP